MFGYSLKFDPKLTLRTLKHNKLKIFCHVTLASAINTIGFQARIKIIKCAGA